MKGVESASLTIGYENGQLTGDGNAVLNLPNVKTASLNFKYNGGDAFKITVDAAFDFKSKFIEEVKLTVTLATGAEAGEGQGGAGGNTGWSLGISGIVIINFPKLDKLVLTVSYIDGLFKADGTTGFGSNNKMISGKISAGISNGVVVNGQLQKGEGGKNLTYYGTSVIKFIPYAGIEADLTVKLEPDGKILYSTEVDAHVVPFAAIKPAPTKLFDYMQVIPLVGVPLLSINLTFGAGANFYLELLPLEIGATASIKNKTLDDIIAGNFTTPTSVTFKTSGKLGIEVNINAGASATIALLEGGAELKGFLKLEAEAELKGKLDAAWEGEKGLKLKGGEGEATAMVNLIPGLKGRIYVDLNLLISRTNLWEHEKKLAEGAKHLLFETGVKAPFSFDDNNKLKPFDTKLLTFKPELNNKTADTEAKKNTDVNNDGPQPLKADDILKNQIKAEVEANMREKHRTQSLDMYQYAAKLRQKMVGSKEQKIMNYVDEALESALTKIEEEEFNEFRLQIMASKDSLAKRLARVNQFQAFHKTINSEWFKTMNDELRAADAANIASTANMEPVQAKLLPRDKAKGTTGDQQIDHAADGISFTQDDSLLNVSPAIENKLDASKGAGNSLPEVVRSDMESSLGTDFKDVRVHTGTDAEKMNEKLNAQAFTKGEDIYFNSDKYNTQTKEGVHLLVHELTHVVQQGTGNTAESNANDGNKNEVSNKENQTVRLAPLSPMVVSADSYAGLLGDKIGQELESQLSQLKLTLDQPYIKWKSGDSRDFVHEIMSPVITAGANLWRKLSETLLPVSPLNAINLGRDSDEWGNGPIDFNPAVARELWKIYLPLIKSSFTRILPQIYWLRKKRSCLQRQIIYLLTGMSLNQRKTKS